MRRHDWPDRSQAARARAIAALTAICTLLAGGCSGINAPAGGAQSADAIPPPTVDDAVRGIPIVAGRPGRVFVFAGFDDKCQSVPEPKISIATPPTKGEVTFMPGQETTIKSSAQGTCIGRMLQGTGVYYTPRIGEKGTDRFVVSAKLASGETATRSFEVQIAE